MAELDQALQEMAERFQFVDTGDVWNRFTCLEIEAIAEVLRLAGYVEVADFVIGEHARGDFDTEDMHHGIWYGRGV
jgi:hypothetical protein